MALTVHLSSSAHGEYLCVCVCAAGETGALVEALPVALLRVVLQLHADAADALQQHGCAVVTICGGERESR